MTPPRSLRGPLILAAFLLLAPAGCLSPLNPIDQPEPEHLTHCLEIPKPCRQRVYVFFIHGMDPLDLANMEGVRDYVQSLGFIKTYYGQMFHTWYFTEEVRRIHERDPEARFALVGFSFGANMVRNMATSVRDDHITIDLVVYLGGNTLTNEPKDRPDNVLRFVNILATGCIWNGTTMDDAENVKYSDVWHFGSPSHKQTLEILGRELTEVAARVPYITRKYEPLETAPTPRPVVPQPVSTEHDEWDFLTDDTMPALPPKVTEPKSPSPNPKRSTQVE